MIMSPPAIRIPANEIPKNERINDPIKRKVIRTPNIYMLAFLAVIILSFSEYRSVSDRNIGVAASGFTTEKREVKLANRRPTMPRISEVFSGMV